MNLGFFCMHLQFLELHMFLHLILKYYLIFLNMLFVYILVHHIQTLLHRIHFLRFLVLLVFLFHNVHLNLYILAIVFLYRCFRVLLLFGRFCYLSKYILLHRHSLKSFLRFLLILWLNFYSFANLHLPIHPPPVLLLSLCST